MTIIKTTSIKSLKHSLIALSLLSSFNLLAQTQVIHAGTLLKVAGDPPLSKQTLVIADGKIIRIEKGFISPNSIAKDAQLIDLSSSFVMAGLMDMHVLKWHNEFGHLVRGDKLTLTNQVLI